MALPPIAPDPDLPVQIQALLPMLATAKIVADEDLENDLPDLQRKTAQKKESNH